MLPALDPDSAVRRSFGAVDDLLRGRFTRPTDLSEGRVTIPAGTLVRACIALGALYGACMGTFSATLSGNWGQVVSSALKVPLLFLLTLVVTVPSLYVLSALAGSRLGPLATLRLLLVAVGVDLAVLASLAPVTLFFTLSTESYPFMKLLNVAAFGVAGILGLVVLRRALASLFEEVVELPPADDPDALLLPTRPSSARRIFGAWLVVYGVVGAQMGWILRPFIGDPGRPFAWFRERDSHFFADLLRTFGDLVR